MAIQTDMKTAHLMIAVECRAPGTQSTNPIRRFIRMDGRMDEIPNPVEYVIL